MIVKSKGAFSWSSATKYFHLKLASWSTWMVRKGDTGMVVLLQRFVHSSLSSRSSCLMIASLNSALPSTALAMDTACPPRRALATLFSAGPVYDAGWVGVLTVTYTTSYAQHCLLTVTLFLLWGVVLAVTLGGMFVSVLLNKYFTKLFINLGCYSLGELKVEELLVVEDGMQLLMPRDFHYVWDLLHSPLWGNSRWLILKLSFV